MSQKNRLSRWFQTPLFHVPSRFGKKNANWLELFYDLIFVAAFIQLGNGLSHHISWSGFLGFVGVFTTLWISWTGFTFYSNRYNVDDFLHRLLVFIQMFAVGAMAITAPEVLSGQTFRFAGAYSVAQFMIALLYARAWLQQKEGRPYAAYWGAIFGVAGLVWGLSMIVPSPIRFGLWGVGILVIFLSPFNRISQSITEEFPIDLHHLSERFGLLTLIVLGESFVKVLSSLETGADSYRLMQAAIVLVITCAVWWLYFDDIGGSVIKTKPLSYIIWMWWHLPLQIGITALGVALKKAVHFDMMRIAPAKYGALLSGAVLLVIISVAIIDSVTQRKNSELSDSVRVKVRMGAGVLIGLIGLNSGAISGGLLIGLLMAVLLAQVLFDILMVPIETQHIQSMATSTDALSKQRAAGQIKRENLRPKMDGIIRKGTPNQFRKDLYFFLIEGSWTRLFAVVIGLYVMINAVFAGIYTLRPGCINGVDPTSFMDAFFFSVETISTIGFGSMVPHTVFGHIVVTIEAIVGVLIVALLTGLVFAKASRPSASIVFSDRLLKTTQNKKPILMFRVGNARGNDIMDANVTVSALIDEVSEEGTHLRRVKDLKLERTRSPFFSLTWTIIHPLDADSPLANLDITDPTSPLISILVTLIGHDGTYGQTIYARHNYDPESITTGKKFKDIVSQMPDGRLMIDYEHIHTIETEDTVN